MVLFYISLYSSLSISLSISLYISLYSLHFTLLTPHNYFTQGCGKSVVVEEFARRLGYETDTIVLFSDMTSRDLLQYRHTDKGTYESWPDLVGGAHPPERNLHPPEKVAPPL